MVVAQFDRSIIFHSLYHTKGFTFLIPIHCGRVCAQTLKPFRKNWLIDNENTINTSGNQDKLTNSLAFVYFQPKNIDSSEMGKNYNSQIPPGEVD